MTDRQKQLSEILSTTNISDALDSFSLKGATYGIRGLYDACRKIYGEAVTLKLIPAGLDKPKVHLGIAAISAAKAGDIIVVDNAGRLDLSCWGGVLATGSSLKGIAGIVIDGACRDIDEMVSLDFPVYARGMVVATARGRVVEEATNVPIQFGGVQVQPGDYVMADRSGVVVVTHSRLDEVLEKAYNLYEKEEAMCADLRAGLSNYEVDHKYNYNRMI